MHSLSLLMALSLPSRLTFSRCDPLCSSLSLLALFFTDLSLTWQREFLVVLANKYASQSPSRPALILRGYQTTVGHSFRKHLLPGLDPPYFSRNLPLVLRRFPIHPPFPSLLHGGTCQGLRFNRLQSISHEWGSVPCIDNMKE